MITKSEIITNAFPRTNVSEYHIMDSFIAVVKDKHLRGILGDDFYDDFIVNYADYADLLAVVKPMLAWFVKYYALPSIYADVSTTGVKKLESNNATSAGGDELGTLKQQALDMANGYANMVYRTLENGTYPLWNNRSRVSIAGGIIMQHYTDEYENNYD
jgi:hypothetical protein